MTKLTDEQMREMLGQLDAHCIRCGKKMSVDELMEGDWASKSEMPFGDIICKDCLTDEEFLESQVNDAVTEMYVGFDGKVHTRAPYVPLEGEWTCTVHPYGGGVPVEFPMSGDVEKVFLEEVYRLTADVEGDIAGIVETYKSQDFETRVMFLALFFYEMHENHMLIVTDRHGNESIQDMMRRVTDVRRIG